jgi:hypothetical protein
MCWARDLMKLRTICTQKPILSRSYFDPDGHKYIGNRSFNLQSAYKYVNKPFIKCNLFL